MQRKQQACLMAAVILALVFSLTAIGVSWVAMHRPTVAVVNVRAIARTFSVQLTRAHLRDTQRAALTKRFAATVPLALARVATKHHWVIVSGGVLAGGTDATAITEKTISRFMQSTGGHHA